MTPSNHPSGKFYTTETLAEHLGVSGPTLIRWRRLRTGPPWLKAGHRVLYRLDDVDQWIAANVVETDGG